jgi:chromate reductase
MSGTKKIGVFVGSLRKESFSRKIALNLQQLAPKNLSLSIVEIGQLPHYNEDLDAAGATPPKEWTDFRATVKGFDGVLFVTPEYNRSFPGVLKNALDVGSRPYGQSVWSKKPGAVVSASPGAIGGFGANQHLRQCFVFLDILCLQQPEVYLSGVHQLLEKDGTLKTPQTRDFLGGFLKAYSEWVEKLAAARM